MNLTNEFIVEAPIDRVWRLLDDVENVVPCMPGAAFEAELNRRIVSGANIKPE